jgi:hypothetical protein
MADSIPSRPGIGDQVNIFIVCVVSPAFWLYADLSFVSLVVWYSTLSRRIVYDASYIGNCMSGWDKDEILVVSSY